MNIVGVVRNGLDVLRVGGELKNAKTWKNVALLGNSLAGLIPPLIGLAAALGYTLPIDLSPADILIIAGALASGWGVVNTVLTAITSAKVGLLPAKPESADVPPIKLVSTGAAADGVRTFALPPNSAAQSPSPERAEQEDRMKMTTPVENRPHG